MPVLPSLRTPVVTSEGYITVCLVISSYAPVFSGCFMGNDEVEKTWYCKLERLRSKSTTSNVLNFMNSSFADVKQPFTNAT